MEETYQKSCPLCANEALMIKINRSWYCLNCTYSEDDG